MMDERRDTGVMAELIDAVSALARCEQLVVACDMDGTIAEFIHDPADVVVNAESVTALCRLAAMPATLAAVVSGRPYLDLAAILRRSGIEGTDRLILVGGHGVEIEGPPQLTPAQRSLVATITEQVPAALAPWPAIIAEHKVTGISVHSRALTEEQAQAAEDRLRGLLADAAWSQGVFVQRGVRMFEVLVLEPNKGAAVEHLRGRFASPVAGVFYAGDDLTDETVFSRLVAGDVGVHIGPKPTAAPFRIADTTALAGVLTTLAQQRQPR